MEGEMEQGAGTVDSLAQRLRDEVVYLHGALQRILQHSENQQVRMIAYMALHRMGHDITRLD